MTILDYAILFLTLSALLILGLTGRSKNESIEAFFLGSRRLSWLRVGASLFATNFSASALVGITGAAYLTGIAIYNYEWIGILSLIFMAIVLYKMLLGAGIYTVSEYLNRRFDDRVMLFYSILTIFMIIFVDLAGALYVGGLILSSLIPSITANNVILFAVIFAGLYVLAGGLTAISRTNSLQFVIILLGSVTLAYFSFIEIQNVNGFPSALPENTLALIRPLDDRAVPWLGLITGIPVLCAYFWFANQNMLQWGLSAKSVRDAQYGLLFVGFLKLSVFFIIVMPGVFAIVLFPEIAEPDQVYLVLLTELLPAGALGLVMTGLGAALLSNTNSSLHAATTIFTLDIVRRLKNNFSERQLILISRSFTIIIIIASALWAREIAKFDTLFEYIQSTLSYLIPPMISIYLGGIFSRKITADAAFYSLLIGVGVSLSVLFGGRFLYDNTIHYLYVPLPICLLCFFSMYFLSYFEQNKNKQEETRSMLVWTRNDLGVSRAPPDRKLLILSIVLAILTIVFVLFFAFEG